MNGLDLDMSQSQALWRKKQQQQEAEENRKKEPLRFGSPVEGKKDKKKGGLLDRGEYLESLDLNIGFESIQKLQDEWYKPRAKQ